MGDVKWEASAAYSRSSDEIPAEGLEKMKFAIKTAKLVKAKRRTRIKKRFTQMATAALVFMLVAIPNVSAEAADAMSEIPIIGVFCEAVTFRDYHYSSERFQADVSVPEIIESTEDAYGQRRVIDKDTKDINNRIRAIADKLIGEFKSGLEENGDGYANLYINYEILHTTDEYFTLKLITFQGAGSGFEQNYYYTIDVDTGKEVMLSDMFPSGIDYVGLISENIKQQMRERMENTESGAMYWVDIEKTDPIYEWSFTQIASEQQFYVNADGELVISFDEGEVAPMYMGTQEFVIPRYITQRSI